MKDVRKSEFAKDRHYLFDGAECKICCKCKRLLPLDKFSSTATNKFISTTDGYDRACKECWAEIIKRWAEA